MSLNLYAKSQSSSNNTSTKSTKNNGKTNIQTEHPPKLTAKLAFGQFPLEVGVEQDYLFGTPERSSEASMSYNPFIGAFRLKSLLSRDLSQDTSIAIGVSHVGMQGVTWLFRYERPELTLSVPILVANFMSPNYWNRVISLSIFSFLMDETLGEVLDVKTNENLHTMDVYDAIATKEHHIVKEQQWMHSSNAKSVCSQQIRIMEHISNVKRENEESSNGLVILSATYEWLPESFDASHYN